MIAGYFTKVPQKNPLRDKELVVKKTCRYAIPYFTYSLIFFLIFHPEGILKNIVRTLYGGFNNITVCSYPYWFINTLFISSICFSYFLWISYRRNQNLFTIILILGIYIIIHIKNIYPFPYPLPWGIDESLGAIIFLYTGFRFKTLKNRTFFIYTLSIIALILWFFFQNENCQYHLNMEKMVYPNWTLDWIIPCSFTAFFYTISKWLKRNHYIKLALSELGSASITIFFTHAAIFSLLEEFNTLLKIIISIVGGYMLHFLISKNKYTQFLFIGKIDFNIKK